MLKVKFYQVVLIVINLVAVLGNAACVPIRLAVHKESMDSSFSILVTNLNAANLLMGVYCGIIAGVDQVFRGNFLNNEKAWTNSLACQLAGVLYLLPSDVSAFTIAVITWGQVTQILSASRDLRYCQQLGNRFTIIACLLVWVLSFTLTATFLFQTGSQWAAHRRSVLCVLTPAASNREHGVYSVVTHAVIRPVTLLLVSVGQAWLYRRVHTHTSTLTTGDSDAHRLARQFTLVAVTDCICWAVVSCISLWSLRHGVAVGEELTAVLVLVIQPVNAAINPCLNYERTADSSKRPGLCSCSRAGFCVGGSSIRSFNEDLTYFLHVPS
jgi:hypothetical protein